MKNIDMSKKVILVTGAASGMGRAFANLALEAGAEGLIAVDMNAELMETLKAELAQKGYEKKLMAVTLNVVDEQGVIKMLENAIARFGRLDCCFNHAAIGAIMSEAADFPTDRFHAVIENNVYGPYNVLRHVLEIMRNQKFGAIVNTASILGFRGMPSTLEYSTSRGAVMAMSKVAALEAANYGVRVNTLCPGLTDTPINDETHRGINPENPKAAMEAIAQAIPLKRYAYAEEQATAALFLLSDAASYISGIDMVVDGALTARAM
ncbi:MAG TPA: SDR family oxidoreductase [Anaerovoracaceae bacterium]|nr:SDR family oxidoreductase [Anaerovoracaceae bacterium]